MKTTLSLALLAAAILSTAQAAAARETRSGPEARDAQATLTVRSTRFGRILFDGGGRALYAFTRDRRGGPSRCYGACATAWPVYFAKRPLRAGAGVRESLIGTTKRRDGRLQVTYNGWPLYYYAHEGRGEVKCQNVDQFGGLWLVVRPGGRLVR
jgi:predicted lipoprotein with Yx(FWY)xxD motif